MPGPTTNATQINTTHNVHAIQINATHNVHAMQNEVTHNVHAIQIYACYSNQCHTGPLNWESNAGFMPETQYIVIFA